MTLAELRAFLDQMSNLPCAMHQIGDVKVSGGGLGVPLNAQAGWGTWPRLAPLRSVNI